MNFDEFLTLTEEAGYDWKVFVNAGGRWADITDVKVEENQVIITIED